MKKSFVIMLVGIWVHGIIATSEPICNRSRRSPEEQIASFSHKIQKETDRVQKQLEELQKSRGCHLQRAVLLSTLTSVYTAIELCLRDRDEIIWMTLSCSHLCHALLARKVLKNASMSQVCESFLRRQEELLQDFKKVHEKKSAF